MGERYKRLNWLQNVYVDPDWTQTKIADECDVSVRTIGNWVTKYEIRKSRHGPKWLTGQIRQRTPFTA
ncbi:helix-turn-helix domain-containing protein [Halarchaeum nitratireducens]|uniref:helix-turn-helix domain-containing protein n=1 Tax=Halarchaeum nitratireducens TaxID=489913 RepID=UPI001B3A9830